MALNDAINPVLMEWGREFLQNRIADIKRTDAERSRELLRSLDVQVIKATTNNLARVLVAFKDYGRHIDMRRLKFDEQIPVKEIEEWVRQVGVGQFRQRFARKYYVPQSDKQLINKIAWGIVKKYQKRRKRKRGARKRWYNKPKERDIGKLYRRLLDAVAEETLSESKETLN